MRLLFICFEYSGEMDPCSRCIQKLRSEIFKHGVSSDVLTYNWCGELIEETLDTYGTIYLANTWYHKARITRNAQGRIHMNLLQLAQVALVRGLSVLLDGKSYAQRGMPIAATSAMGRRLQKLCYKKQYDWVVSVSYPFANHVATIKRCPKGTKIALYNLDPYYNNQSYSHQRVLKRKAEEVAIYNKAQKIICTMEQGEDYIDPAFNSVRSKIHPLPYPNLTQQQVNDLCTIPFDSNNINLVYLGTIYGDIRKPDALFKLFEKMVQEEPRLRLYIIGKKFGLSADKYLVEFSNRLKNNLICCEPIPSEQTYDVMQKADVLVSIGNTVQNQMPSKLIEYISTGKPIMSIGMVSNCNSIPLLNKHPNKFLCTNQECSDSLVVANAVKFCRENAGKTIPWSVIEKCYSDITLTSVANHFLRILEDD